MLFNANAKAIVWHTPCLSSWQKKLPKCKSLVFTSGWLIFFPCWNPTIHCEEAYKANLTYHRWLNPSPHVMNTKIVKLLPCYVTNLRSLFVVVFRPTSLQLFASLELKKDGQEHHHCCTTLKKSFIAKSFISTLLHFSAFFWLQRHCHLQLQWC
jgi:hypothetical protein